MLGRVVLATCGLIAATAVATAAPAQAAAKTPGVTTKCGGSTVAVRPKTLVIACGKKPSTVSSLKWSTWGTSTAKGTGKITKGAKSYPVKVTLGKAKTHDTVSYFTSATVAYTKQHPKGTAASQRDTLPTPVFALVPIHPTPVVKVTPPSETPPGGVGTVAEPVAPIIGQNPVFVVCTDPNGNTVQARVADPRTYARFGITVVSIQVFANTSPPSPFTYDSTQVSMVLPDGTTYAPDPEPYGVPVATDPSHPYPSGGVMLTTDPRTVNVNDNSAYIDSWVAFDVIPPRGTPFNLVINSCSLPAMISQAEGV